ncbi:hypothetical protein [Streptomyces sp. AcE210]|nr:hypothetical protein [Streptomyces sp. AcE210]
MTMVSGGLPRAGQGAPAVPAQRKARREYANRVNALEAGAQH